MVRAALLALLLPVQTLAADISLTTSDGVKITATTYGEGEKGVVLIHEEDRSKTDWSYLGEKLAGRGFFVIAPDLRGHGASLPPDVLTDTDYPKMQSDVDVCVKYLRTEGATNVAMVGSKLGGSLALFSAAADPEVGMVIVLSPQMSVKGIKAASALTSGYGDRPLFLVHSARDAYSTKSVNFFTTRMEGEPIIETLEASGSGIKMLNREADLEIQLFSWLNGSFDALDKAIEGKDESLKAQAVDSLDIETTGTKFGEQR